jgi:hypothetical protein
MWEEQDSAVQFSKKKDNAAHNCSKCTGNVTLILLGKGEHTNRFGYI